MRARAIMVQGTASSVGKSVVATALCRFFRREGLRVAPFKAVNMSLNAAVTPDGGEIGRAQAVQAEAARVTPTVHMNPVLIKPEGAGRAQVVVLGKPAARLEAGAYDPPALDLRAVVRASLDRLRAEHDLVVIEGAGSPAEVNLKDRDIANMFVAEAADCRVVLVGDIDRGGVFASLVGTMELLDAHERARVGALLVNKFRGDVALLAPGLRFLEQRTGVPVLGVVPFVQRLRVADEDGVAIDDRRPPRVGPRDVEIAVVRLPRISNHDEFQPLEHEPGVVVRFVEDVEGLGDPDLVVVPGTKGTVADLRWLRSTGFADAITARARRGRPVLGVCGGCQMLGERIDDPDGVESRDPWAPALGLLPATTRFAADKRTAQVRARSLAATFLGPAGEDVSAYEIHMGRLERRPGSEGLFAIAARNGAPDGGVDGAIGAGGAVVGTMFHGLFDNAGVRRALVASLRARRGLPAPEPPGQPGLEADELDRLADVLRSSIDVGLLFRLLDA